jgi:hypothetical protein
MRRLTFGRVDMKFEDKKEKRGRKRKKNSIGA